MGTHDEHNFLKPDCDTHVSQGQVRKKLRTFKRQIEFFCGTSKKNGNFCVIM